MILSLAGLNIEVINRYSYIEKIAVGYTVETDKVDFSVSVTDEDILMEAEATEEKFSNGYLESIAIYRKIAERLPEYGAVVFHGVVLCDKDEAYIVAAKSGTGKTTHARLWLKEFGDDVFILNGDKPIIRIIDGTPYACGTPWKGKEGYGVPGMKKLSAIAMIVRDKDPAVEPLGIGEASLALASQTYIPESEKCAPLALRVISGLIKTLNFYKIRANMDSLSARVARDGLKSKIKA